MAGERAPSGGDSFVKQNALAIAWLSAFALAIALIAWRIAHPKEGEGEVSFLDAALSAKPSEQGAPAGDDGLDPEPLRRQIEHLENEMWSTEMRLEELMGTVMELAMELGQRGGHAASRKLIFFSQSMGYDRAERIKEWVQIRDRTFRRAPWFHSEAP